VTIPQVFEVTQLFDFYYGVTWSTNYKNLFNWKEVVSGDFEQKVKHFFDRRRFLRVLRDYIIFLTKDDVLTKVILRQHQVRGVEKVLQRVEEGTRQHGLIWHTQGSGKSLSMAFYASKIAQRVELANPTLVVLTDRNDLDDQLFGTFSMCRDLIRQTPQQAGDRDEGVLARSRLPRGRRGREPHSGQPCGLLWLLGARLAGGRAGRRHDRPPPIHRPPRPPQRAGHQHILLLHSIKLAPGALRFIPGALDPELPVPLQRGRFLVELCQRRQREAELLGRQGAQHQALDFGVAELGDPVVGAADLERRSGILAEWFSRNHERLIATGILERAHPPAGQVTRCTVPGCERERLRRTCWCRTHQYRWQQAGRPEPTIWLPTEEARLPLGPTPPQCAVPLCLRQAKSGRFCGAHVQRWAAAGKPDVEKWTSSDEAAVPSGGWHHRWTGYFPDVRTVPDHLGAWLDNPENRYADVRSTLVARRNGTVAGQLARPLLHRTVLQPPISWIDDGTEVASTAPTAARARLPARATGCWARQPGPV